MIWVIKWEFIVGTGVIRWIGDVILIHLGTFKPMDRHYVCLGASTWVFDMLSIFIGITHP